MHNLKKLGKKLFTMSVVSMTVAWSVGLSAFVPAGAAAATCPELESGDLFKIPKNSAVYLVGPDMKRAYFPNAAEYFSWYKDFSGITTIDPTCVDAYPAGGSVNFRPGSRLVKVAISPSMYAVGPNNTLLKISEANAAALYGANWSKAVVTVADVFFQQYTMGAEITSATLHDGQLVKKAGESTVYYVWGGKLKMVEGTLPSQVAGDVRTVSAAVFSSVPMDSASVTGSTVISNPTQKGGSSTPSNPSNNGGSLSVGLAADTAAATTVAGGTVYNNMLKVTVSATSADVNVKGLTVTRTGLVSNTSIAGVSVWDASGNRRGDVMSSFSSDNKVTVGFSGKPVFVAKGQSTTLTVAFNIASGVTSGTVGATIASAADVATDGTVSGSFPIVGNTMSLVSGVTVADVQLSGVSAAGLSDQPGSTTSGNLEIGETKEIAKIKFTQNNGNSDIVVSKLTFYMEGSLKDKDLKDFKVLAPDNTVLGSTAMISDRYVTINFDKPYTVTKSNNRTLTLQATVADGSGNWFRAQVQNDYDVMVKDISTGYFILPTNGGATTFTAVSSSAGYFKMKSGAATVTKATDSPSSNVSAGANDVVLGRFEVKAVGEDLEIRKMYLRVATSTGGKGLTGSVKVRSGNDTLLTVSASDTTYDLYKSGGTEYSLSQYLNLKSGETKIVEVVGSINTAATSVSTYQPSIGRFYAKRLATLDFASDLAGSSLTTANTVTVDSTSVTLSADTSVGSMTRSTGATQVVGQYIVKAGSAEALKLTNFTFSFGSTGTEVASGLQNLQLFVDGVQYGSTISTLSTSSNSFLGNITIEKNQSKVLTLKAYINASATGAITPTVSSFTYVGVDTQNTSSDTAGYQGQTTTVGSAAVILSAVSDTSTQPRILTPTAVATQVGKFKLEAQNEAVTLKKLTFSVHNGADHSTSTANANLGTYYLYDAADMSKELGTASYIGGTLNSYVRFNGLSLVVPADSYKNLVVKATVNGSHVMAENTITYLAVRSELSDDLELVSSSGATLATSAISTVTGQSNTGVTTFATSTSYLFHNAVPVIAAVDLGKDLELSQTAKIFKFTISNPGTKDLRIGTTTVNVFASGLQGNGTVSGTINTWKLYDASVSGDLGTLLAATSTCALIGGAPSGSCSYNANSASIPLVFGQLTQQNGLFNNLTVAAGGSRTFIVTANTMGIANGKSVAGSVGVSAVLDGATGISAGSWATGVIEYYYTPTSESENGTAYTASDSYDVTGGTLSRQI